MLPKIEQKEEIQKKRNSKKKLMNKYENIRSPPLEVISNAGESNYSHSVKSPNEESVIQETPKVSSPLPELNKTLNSFKVEEPVELSPEVPKKPLELPDTVEIQPEVEIMEPNKDDDLLDEPMEPVEVE
jgi:hypothetical protein